MILFYIYSDEDSNGELTASEFASLPAEEVDEEEWEESDRKWKEERVKEFNQVIDLDKDGVVSRDELLVSYFISADFKEIFLNN